MKYFKLLGILAVSLNVLYGTKVMAMDTDPSESHRASGQVVHKKLVLVYQGPDRKVCSISSNDGVKWNPVRETVGIMLESPAAASFANRIYCAVHGDDHRPYISSTDNGENWGDFHPIQETLMSFSPSLANFQDKLFMAVHGRNSQDQPDGNIWCAATSDGIKWQPPIKLSIESKVEGSPSLSIFNNKLYCGYAVKDGDHQPNKIMYTASSNGDKWDPELQVTNAYTYDQSPPFTIFNSSLYCYYNASGEIWYTQTADGVEWDSVQRIPKMKLSCAPTLSVLNGKLYCACQGCLNDKQLCYTSTSDGQNWGINSTSNIQIPNVAIESSPALVTFDGVSEDSPPSPTLVVVYGVGYDGPFTPGTRSFYSVSSTDGLKWNQPNLMPGGGHYSVALASFGNKLYCASTRMIDNVGTQKPWISWTSDGETWSDFSPVKDIKIVDLSLASLNHKLFLAVQKADDNNSATEEIWYTSTYSENGDSWDSWQMLPIRGAQPSLFAFQNKLYCGVYQSMSGQYTFIENSNGVKWGPTGFKSLDKNTWGPFVVFNNGLQGPNNDRVYYTYGNEYAERYYSSSLNGSDWEAPPHKIPNVACSGTAALSVFKDKLYCVYQKTVPVMSKLEGLWYTSTSNGKDWGVDSDPTGPIPNAINLYNGKYVAATLLPNQ